MMRVPLNQVKNDLSRYLRLAEKENVIITRHGVPAGMLVGFEDPEDWWEELLLRDPRLIARVADARKSLREGKGITLEEFRKEHALDEVRAIKPKAGKATTRKRVASNKHNKRTNKVVTRSD